MNIKKTILKLAKQYLTEEDIVSLFTEKFEHINRSKQEDELLFEDLRKIEGFSEYLTNTLASDKDRYFSAGSPMEQLMVKGAYNRTLYLRSKLRDRKLDKEVKLDSPRHAD